MNSPAWVKVELRNDSDQPLIVQKQAPGGFPFVQLQIRDAFGRSLSLGPRPAEDHSHVEHLTIPPVSFRSCGGRMTAMMTVVRTGMAVLVSFAGCVTIAQAESDAGSSQIRIRAEVMSSGRVRFDESIEFQCGQAADPKLTRQLPAGSARGVFPLAGRVLNVLVTDAAGSPLDFRTRAYGEWLNVDLVELPDDGVIHIRYEAANVLDFRHDEVELQWNSIGFFWNLAVKSASVEVVLPESPKSAVEVRANPDFGPYAAANVEVVDRMIRWQSSGPIGPNEKLDWAVTFPKQGIERPGMGNYLRELWIQGSIPLWLGLMLVVALPILRRLPTSRVIGFTRAWNVLTVVAVLFVMLPLVWYWVCESPYRGGDAGSVVSEGVGVLGLVAFLGMYVWRQDRWIVSRDREAYFLEIALPVILAVFLPMFTVKRAILFFPLLGLPVLVYWMRQRVGLQFGAGIHLLVERVVTEGHVSFASLARTFQIDKEQLARILMRRGELPVVTDFEHETVYAPEVAALKEDFAVCANCGGATEAKAMALVECPYCEREYAGSRAAKPRRPVPVIVEALARLAETFGASIAFLFILVAVGGIGIELAEGGDIGSILILAVVVASLGAGIGLLLRHFGNGIRRGRYYGITRFTLLIGTPLVVPLLVYCKLGSRLLRLHFGKIEAKQIAQELRNCREIRLDELAAYLGTTAADAAATARYLTGNDLIDAVFDRVGQRLVCRQLYRTLAHAGACDGCGGILGVLGGTVACHYCGRGVEESRER